MRDFRIEFLNEDAAMQRIATRFARLLGREQAKS
jgi:hypothetical protein